MPKRKCGFGFSCAAMMFQPGLEPIDCPNYRTCGSASELTPEEEVELIRVRQVQQQQAQQEWELILERFRISRREAAVMMLMARGYPQSLDDFGILEFMDSIQTQLAELRSRSEQFAADCYIAPNNCEAHIYNVKRPYGTYWYNKLSSTEAIFEPEEKEEKVKVLHLSHSDDPRNTEARLGIERRNRLHKLQTQLQIAETALEQAIALVIEPLE
jgi:hypothetical protein